MRLSNAISLVLYFKQHVVRASDHGDSTRVPKPGDFRSPNEISLKSLVQMEQV